MNTTKKEEEEEDIISFVSEIEEKPNNINTHKMPNKLKDKNDNFVPYDVVIDITSIKNLNNPGWKIIYNGKKEAQIKNIKLKNRIVISVLGNSNRGKTYLLQKLSGSDLQSGYQVQTKGLSLKFHDDLIFLDTAGTNVPLLLEKGQKRPNEEELQNIQLCQIITNYIIQKFVIEYADILICVVGMLNSKEQIFLNKIKKLCEDKKDLIVIHNLVKCESCEDIAKYKNETLLKMISCELIEKKIPDFDNKNEEIFNKYFLEKGNEHVLHFIFANDEKKKSDIDKSKNLEKYNKATLNYIKKLIKLGRKTPKDFFDNFLEHIKSISSNVLKQKITPYIEEDFSVIKCKEKEIIPRDIKADELDNIIFIGKDYEPLYLFYRRGQYFVLEIQICCKDFNVNVNHTLDTDSNETIFTIEGNRTLDMTKEKEINYLTNKRINFNKFKISQKIKLSDFGISRIGKKPKDKRLNYGILYYIYEILK